jgi:ShK domain-like protein
MHDERKILLAVVLFIIILLLLKKKKYTPPPKKDDNLVITDPETLKTLPQVKVHPTHMPIYGIAQSADGEAAGKGVPAADFESVPVELGNFWKPLEPKGVKIIDPKIVSKNKVQNQTRSDVETEIELQEKNKELIAEMVTIGNNEVQKNKQQINNEINMVKNIKLDTDCYEFIPELCQKWKHNNECIINPKFMLENCPSSCGSCSMSSSVKSSLNRLYQMRAPINCITHGGYSTNESTEDI